MDKKVSIRCFQDQPYECIQDAALVAVDVIRATTTAITAVWMGWSCHVVPTLQAAFDAASRLPNALLAGELGGQTPAGFHIANSPAVLASLSANARPLVLLSSTGTRLMHQIRNSSSAFAACFRNYRATADYLAQNHDAVILIGAGTRGEFREEDQMCCAWIAAALCEKDFVPEDDATLKLIARWRNASQDAFLTSRSVAYLRRTGQLGDLDFILDHFDDLDIVCRLTSNELQDITAPMEVYK